MNYALGACSATRPSRAGTEMPRDLSAAARLELRRRALTKRRAAVLELQRRHEVRAVARIELQRRRDAQER